MTPEQITMLLNILQNTPLQLLLLLAIYIAYRDVKAILVQRLNWLSDQLGAYMERDRQIVQELVKPPPIAIASKWQELPPRDGRGS